jgi:hypothetical protein
MSEETHAPGAALASMAPSSSRMVAGYLTDVEQLIEAQRWDAALCEAYDLPRIAVALTDPTLRSSGERQKIWCEEWIRPEDADADDEGLDYERLRRTVCEHIETEDTTKPKAVPAQALRRLRLRRHVREIPRESTSSRNSGTSETAQICTALVDATRRWYARSACHDTTVQANLARLAVLR